MAHFIFTSIADWPPLAWIARCDARTGEVAVLHGGDELHEPVGCGRQVDGPVAAHHAACSAAGQVAVLGVMHRRVLGVASLSVLRVVRHRQPLVVLVPVSFPRTLHRPSLARPAAARLWRRGAAPQARS